ncbi:MULTISPECIES: hypothetical protein [Enterobacterales]|uniref:RiboL-PSP-HEPN domain-containing protein n=1 Tax=Pectobacterium brasiliense TaxID=180957 RepID=A0AAE3BGD3_9GAMM|nr:MULTISPECIES: hypothetical protein [Enterobacterales]MBF8474963.1 hypothetical protein [Klebsiella michiganensis]MBN3052420.1 hypothetical protein [Pectobacterium brasiliense]MBZ6604959.1 hypothetical protein [Klebsiella michiganensis]
MNISCIDVQLEKIAIMFDSVEIMLSNEQENSTISMHNEMSGLLSITISAIYENCIKFIMEQYSLHYHEKFNSHVKESYDRLNSRIRIENLKSYISALSGNKDNFERYISVINRRYVENIEVKYEQILNYRHKFAHANINDTTIDELKVFFKFSKHVIYAFESALIGNIKSEFVKGLEQKIRYLSPMHTASGHMMSSFGLRVASLREQYLLLECEDILLSIEKSLYKLAELHKSAKSLSLSPENLGKLPVYEKEIKELNEIISNGKKEIINRVRV